MFMIVDDFNAEPIIEKIETFEDAISELRNISKIPFGEEPNIPPSVGWKNCQREFHIIEYEDSQKPGKVLSDKKALLVSASGVKWFYLIGGYIWQG